MLNLLMFVGLLGSCDVLQRVQSVEILVAPLSSPNTDSRAEAQQTLRALVDSDPTVLESLAMEQALTIAMETEYVALRSADRPPPSHVERFDSVVMPVVSMMLGRSKTLSAPFLRAASRTEYIPGSEFSRQLARIGSPMIVIASQLVADPNLLPRLKGYRLLGQIVQADRSQLLPRSLSAQQSSSVIETLRMGLQDSNRFVRTEAIDGIVDAGDVGALPLLTLLSTNDPDGGSISVRSKAMRAIQQLQQ